MHEIRCAEVWGGIRDEDVDACSRNLTTSLFSHACDGGKGGDIYYLSVCAADRLTRIALADVAGHGQAVTDVSQWLYDAMNERMNDARGNHVLGDLNQLAVEHGFRAITTAAVVGFYAGENSLLFSYAGHHPALLRRNGARDWCEVTLDRSSGQYANLPLGIVSEAAYDLERRPARSGDRLLLYTDGVLEAPDANGAQFGIERLQRVLDENAHADLPGLKHAVLEAVRGHTNGSLDHDDVTLLAIEIR